MPYEKFEIAIIGAGPGGLSAAAHAAELGVSHVLLESSPKIANTIQKYQRGKHVMAEPGVLPLRSPLQFGAARREEILAVWEQGVASRNTNIRFNAEVVRVEGEIGNFRIGLSSGDQVQAKRIVLGIGVQGNPRTLDIPGDTSEFVQYQLDDPGAYQHETIVVVGAGDAAIENCIALAPHNKVHIVNRRDEFARAKEGNLGLIMAAIESGSIECFYGTTPARIEPCEDKAFAGVFVLDTPGGEAQLKVHRIIGRLGAVAPRGLVESFGIEFPNNDPNSIPALSSQYESNIKGIYLIGALGGYPLIKQAMNQGYEVVEYILGNKVQPADHDLLAQKFSSLPFELEVDEILELAQSRIPVFSDVNALQFRELMLDSKVHVAKNGEEIFRRNDYANSFFTILEGNVDIQVNESVRITARVGDFFGEMSLLSGRRRSATVFAGKVGILIETPRRTMNKLIASVEAVKKVLDQTFIVRSIQQKFAPDITAEDMLPVAEKTVIHHYLPGEVIFNEGDEGDNLHFIRSGSVTVSNSIEGRELITNYVPANHVVGEMALLGNTKRTATVKATVKTETLSVNREAVEYLLEKSTSLKERAELLVEERHRQNVALPGTAKSGELLSFLMQQGLGEATDVLLIDEDLCVACDFCESACAATHGGTSRLDRKAGPTFAHIHVPTSCRHCEDPSCMKDCPPDAIHRGGIGGEVFIGDNCIGCGNCEQNCPYGVIQMAGKTKVPDGFWSWLLFGIGQEPGHGTEVHAENSVLKQAVKCDMCKDLSGGPACVRTCPTGAALRLSPEAFVDLVNMVR